MKRLILSLALVSTALFVATASAEKPEKGGKGKRPESAEGRPGPGRNPQMMVARIMEEFDKDNDEKLDKTELAAWLKVMQQRRGEFMGKGGKPGAGKAGAARKGKRAADDDATPGGDSPKRPESE